jgi:hypothetical protein
LPHPEPARSRMLNLNHINCHLPKRDRFILAGFILGNAE